MTNLSDLHPVKGSSHRKKRVGRGQGSGWGTNAGRGGKGQTARTGSSIRPGFEGGQMPLQRRIPKRGFKNVCRVEYAEVTLEELLRVFPNGGTISLDSLKEKGLVVGTATNLKILGDAELTGAYQITTHRITAPARTAIEAKGGSVHLLTAARQYRRISLGNISKKFPKKADAVIEVSPATLLSVGLLKSVEEAYEIVASGTISGKYAVSAHRVSNTAKLMIEGKGGRVSVLDPANDVLKINFDHLRSWFPRGGAVTPDTLKKIGVLKAGQRVRLTDAGRVTKAWTVEVHQIGRLAKKKLEAAGGTVKILPTR
jgi:large subunit ribosomal protein L15